MTLSMRLAASACALIVWLGPVVARAADDITGAGGVAMLGKAKYPPDFQHLDYVDPSAPKGGDVRLAAIGSFDTLNPYIVRGVPAAGLGLVYQTLMDSTLDEPFSEYGMIAESIDIPADRSWVAFTLRPEARWNDGTPITAADVIWSFQTLKEKGLPFYGSYYSEVVSAQAIGERKVKFSFKGPGNRELPLIVGQLPILPKHYRQSRDFGATTLEPPLGSGPYRIRSVAPGQSIVYERVADWWAKDLPLNRGRYNFDTIEYDYYRDETVNLEAFFAGRYDFRNENVAKNWATAYGVPAVKAGDIVRDEVKNELPAGMQAFVYNTRRGAFKDARVREALGYAFDFEWSNKTLAYGLYTRTRSYFDNSELASSGVPAGPELAILEPFRGRVPDAVFTTEYQPPKTDGSGNIRDNLLRATELLRSAGWELRDNRLVNAKTGQPFTFEIVVDNAVFDRWVQPFLRNLERLGIKPAYRVVDPAQYQNRLNDFDFDMTIAVFGESLSPGNEQVDFWGSSRADEKGSGNLIGIKDPVVDQLIEHIVHAPDRESLVTAVHALDRVLQWNHYVIPQWHTDRFRLAYWAKFAHPAVAPKYGLGFPDTWWVAADKAARIVPIQGRASN